MKEEQNVASTKVISYSEIDTYRQCPLKHQLSYLERWRTDDEAEALGRGTLFHSVMEAHYGAVKAAKEAGKAVDAVSLYASVSHLLYDRQTGQQTDRQELVEWIYRGYVELYGVDSDWEIVAIEMPLEFWIPNENGNRTPYKLAGTADLLVRDMSAGGGLWIVDHKTCKNLPRQKDFDMEDQTAIYTLLMKLAGYDIRGAIYNHCRTEKLKTREMTHEERFKRTLTVRGEIELKTMTMEALDEMREAYRTRPLVGCPKCVGTGVVALKTDPFQGLCPKCEGTGVMRKDARRRPDGERCGWKCGFTEPCLAARKGADLGAMMKDFGFTVHDTKPGPTFTNRAKVGLQAK